MRNTTPDTILAIDPGLRELGYAVLRGDDLMMQGVLSLGRTNPARRIPLIATAMTRLVRGFAPSTLVLEGIPKHPLDTLVGLPALGRFLQHFAKRLGLNVTSYSARSVRQAVLGDGWAGKRELAQHVAHRFPELRVYLTQDRKWKERYWNNMFDAVGLALRHQRELQPPSRSR